MKPTHRAYFHPDRFVQLEVGQTQSRIWFMGEGLVRIRTSFTGNFPEASLSLVWTAWKDHYDALLGPQRRRTEALEPVMDDRNPEQLVLTCGESIVRVQWEPFCISCGTAGRPAAFREVSGYAYTHSRGTVTHRFCLDDSCFYGFGEKTGPLEKTGTSMRMSNKDACGYDPRNTDPLYKHVPWFIKLSPDGEEACGIYYNTASDCSLDIGREYNGYWPRMGQYRCCSDEVDYFFIPGPSMAQVVQKFCRLTGCAALLPRYAFGYLGSTMFYSELPENCDEEILSFVRKTARKEIPCSNFQLSSGYTTDNSGKRNVFSWNLRKFPRPESFVTEMDKLGVSITPNIKPALLTTNPLYETFRQAGAFIRTGKGDPYVTQFWGGKGSLVDFSNPEGRRLWQKYLKESLLDKGIYSVWNDNNEFEITDDDAVCQNEGIPVPAWQLRGSLPMLMNITSRQALEEAYPNRRLYQVTRSGSAGICRYAQTWTGDNRTGWDSLRYNIATMLGCGLSGISLTGSDVGGFAGPAPDAELFVRWIWCGVLMPRFSIHSANNDNTVTEPWMYPEKMDAIRKAFRLRRQLIPYLYSLNAHASRCGEPLMRPMVYEFPGGEKLRREEVDFMLGKALLCACVVEPGASQREIYLPEGEVFYDLFSRKAYRGGQIIRVAAPEDSTPLFQRGGSILPLQEDCGLGLWICPDKDCSFTLYEDDGLTNEYQNGAFLSSEFTLTRRAELVRIHCNRQGCFVSKDSLYFHIQCAGKAPAQILWNEVQLPQILDENHFRVCEAGWHYYPSTSVCSIRKGNGRDLDRLTVNFGSFDLIRMDTD